MERPLFVLFGSSHVQFSFYQGWGATLAHAYARKADVVLRGYAGWNSKRALEVIEQIFPKHATRQPALVILYFGGNDSTRPHPCGLGPHVPKDKFKENIRKIINYISELSKETRIIFLSVPPINEDKLEGDKENPRRTNEDCRLYSEAGLEVCRELKIKAIDLWSALTKRPDWKDVSFVEDGIHFSHVASEIVLKEILNAIREAYPNLHWSSIKPEFGKNSKYDPVIPNGNGFKNFNISDVCYPKNAEWASKIIISPTISKL